MRCKGMKLNIEVLCWQTILKLANGCLLLTSDYSHKQEVPWAM